MDEGQEGGRRRRIAIGAGFCSCGLTNFGCLWCRWKLNVERKGKGMAEKETY
jgi:hypothetical protein